MPEGPITPATPALTLSQRHPRGLYTLFDRAVARQKQALGCDNVTKERRPELEQRLALYQNHKPYCEGRKKEKAAAVSP